MRFQATPFPLVSRIQERRGSKVGPLSRLPERRAHCRDCGMTHGRMRYVHPQEPPQAGPGLRRMLPWLIAAGIVAWFFILGALVPWIVSILQRAAEAFR